MTTIRQQLDNENFDWLTGTIWMEGGLVPHDSPSLDVEFHDGYGSVQGEPFVAWDMNWTYVPIRYDGAEWIERVPRSPELASIIEYRPEHFGG